MISIIVPVYNTEKYLRKCIESIQDQTLKDIEIILVDDGSKDSSGMICDEYGEMDSRIKVIHKPNGGLVSARKAGIQAAKGSYVGFVDSDDWIEKDMFRIMHQQAWQAKADIVAEGFIEDVYGLYQCCRNVLKAGIYSSDRERTFFYQNMLNCEAFFCLGIQPYLWNKLIRREIAEVCIMDMEESIKVGEDAAVIYPAFLEAKSIAVMDECHYHYCLRNASMIWKRESEEKEFVGAIVLHKYLKDKFSGMEERYCLEKQLERYSLNNLLVRSLGVLARKHKGTVLFPFNNVKKGDSVVLYGAGALGRAVYQYVDETKIVVIKGWADQNALAYQKLGLPVEVPEQIHVDKHTKILIAVLRKKAEKSIRERLIGMGTDEKQIIGVSFEDIVECFNRYDL